MQGVKHQQTRTQAFLAIVVSMFVTPLKQAAGVVETWGRVFVQEVELRTRRLGKFSGGFVYDSMAAVAGLGIVLIIVGAIVVVLIIAALATPFFDALGSIIENFTIVELGDSDAANIAETIIRVLAIVVAVGGAFLLVGFALKAFKAKG